MTESKCNDSSVLHNQTLDIPSIVDECSKSSEEKIHEPAKKSPLPSCTGGSSEAEANLSTTKITIDQDVFPVTGDTEPEVVKSLHSLFKTAALRIASGKTLPLREATNEATEVRSDTKLSLVCPGKFDGGKKLDVCGMQSVRTTLPPGGSNVNEQSSTNCDSVVEQQGTIAVNVCFPRTSELQVAIVSPIMHLPAGKTELSKELKIVCVDNNESNRTSDAVQLAEKLDPSKAELAKKTSALDGPSWPVIKKMANGAAACEQNSSTQLHMGLSVHSDKQSISNHAGKSADLQGPERVQPSESLTVCTLQNKIAPSVIQVSEKELNSSENYALEMSMVLSQLNKKAEQVQTAEPLSLLSTGSQPKNSSKENMVLCNVLTEQPLDMEESIHKAEDLAKLEECVLKLSNAEVCIEPSHKKPSSSKISLNEITSSKAVNVKEIIDQFWMGQKEQLFQKVKKLNTAVNSVLSLWNINDQLVGKHSNITDLTTDDLKPCYTKIEDSNIDCIEPVDAITINLQDPSLYEYYPLSQVSELLKEFPHGLATAETMTHYSASSTSEQLDIENSRHQNNHFPKSNEQNKLSQIKNASVVPSVEDNATSDPLDKIQITILTPHEAAKLLSELQLAQSNDIKYKNNASDVTQAISDEQNHAPKVSSPKLQSPCPEEKTVSTSRILGEASDGDCKVLEVTDEKSVCKGKKCNLGVQNDSTDCILLSITDRNTLLTPEKRLCQTTQNPEKSDCSSRSLNEPTDDCILLKVTDGDTLINPKKKVCYTLEDNKEKWHSNSRAQEEATDGDCVLVKVIDSGSLQSGEKEVCQTLKHCDQSTLVLSEEDSNRGILEDSDEDCIMLNIDGESLQNHGSTTSQASKQCVQISQSSSAEESGCDWGELKGATDNSLPKEVTAKDSLPSSEKETCAILESCGESSQGEEMTSCSPAQMKTTNLNLSKSGKTVHDACCMYRWLFMVYGVGPECNCTFKTKVCEEDDGKIVQLNSAQNSEADGLPETSKSPKLPLADTDVSLQLAPVKGQGTKTKKNTFKKKDFDVKRLKLNNSKKLSKSSKSRPDSASDKRNTNNKLKIILRLPINNKGFKYHTKTSKPASKQVRPCHAKKEADQTKKKVCSESQKVLSSSHKTKEKLDKTTIGSSKSKESEGITQKCSVPEGLKTGTNSSGSEAGQLEQAKQVSEKKTNEANQFYKQTTVTVNIVLDDSAARTRKDNGTKAKSVKCQRQTTELPQGAAVNFTRSPCANTRGTDDSVRPTRESGQKKTKIDRMLNNLEQKKKYEVKKELEINQPKRKLSVHSKMGRPGQNMCKTEEKPIKMVPIERNSNEKSLSKTMFVKPCSVQLVKPLGSGYKHTNNCELKKKETRSEATSDDDDNLFLPDKPTVVYKSRKTEKGNPSKIKLLEHGTKTRKPQKEPSCNTSKHSMLKRSLNSPGLIKDCWKSKKQKLSVTASKGAKQDSHLAKLAFRPLCLVPPSPRPFGRIAGLVHLKVPESKPLSKMDKPAEDCTIQFKLWPDSLPQTNLRDNGQETKELLRKKYLPIKEIKSKKRDWVKKSPPKKEDGKIQDEKILGITDLDCTVVKNKSTSSTGEEATLINIVPIQNDSKAAFQAYKKRYLHRKEQNIVAYPEKR
ncbi:uncharacterized protein LOC102356508 [Latimeria chalumnae]|uniref:uncharacterized protein LOC102356508 n=1 Tax=Latimeria chalumnae TaxID=7897 RepID=UPI0003C11BF0